MRTLSQICIAAGLVFGLANSGLAEIEAVRGKSYLLTKQHGPWMVMVASFRDVNDERKVDGGLSAEEAAGELVYELRKKGIPAYTFRQDAQLQSLKTVDRLGRDDTRIFAAQRDMVCVIAGNYPEITDETAQKTLSWIKRFHPDFMRDEKAGAIYRVTPGRKGPLSGAFLTVNPMIDPSEVPRVKSDELLVTLNSGGPNSLAQLKQPYTLKVATFVGRSSLPNSKSERMSSFAGLAGTPQQGEVYDLNRAGEDAAQLAQALRKQGVEAYVFHDHHKSVVTIGGFDDPRDPRIAVLAEQYKARQTTDPTTQQTVMVAQSLSAPGNGRNAAPLTWIFDPQPEILPTPRLR